MGNQPGVSRKSDVSRNESRVHRRVILSVMAHHSFSSTRGLGNKYNDRMLILYVIRHDTLLETFRVASWNKQGSFRHSRTWLLHPIFRDPLGSWIGRLRSDHAMVLASRVPREEHASWIMRFEGNGKGLGKPCYVGNRKNKTAPASFKRQTGQSVGRSEFVEGSTLPRWLGSDLRITIPLLR